MSSANLKQDPCSYQEKLKRSIGPGMYMLGTPANDCAPCGKDIPNDPHLRWQSWGPGFCEPGSTVDTGSELRGLNYRNTKCASEQYLPGKYTPKQGGVCAPAGKYPIRGCATPTESTRLSNPPCTLRATGWNRWEWLCYDPQDKAVVPFDYLVSNRIMVKDNHVPCIPNPQNQTNEIQGSVAGEINSLTKWTPPPNSGAAAPGNADAAVSYRSCEHVKAVNGF
jgi:hypothetical protein